MTDTPISERRVEANQSAKSVQQIIEKLLAALGHEQTELAATVEQ